MTIARSKQICLEQTTWYHCTTRCVRRAFICGFDNLTKRDYSHRQVWIEERLLFLAQVFCIDLAAYAVMSNHYHVLLRVDIDKAQALSDKEVVRRWCQVFSGSGLAMRFLNDGELDDADKVLLASKIKYWRSELANISRFMAQVNQYIAVKANKEDECKGRFWEARFHSQALLDADAVLRTLTYIELNPVRAGITTTPESSKHTSVVHRLKNPDSPLLPFASKPTAHSVSSDIPKTHLPITFDEYLVLLDWTGRGIRHDNKGSIPTDAPNIFERLGYSPQQWLKSQMPTVTWQQRALGSAKKLKGYCAWLTQNWIWRAKEHEIMK